MSSPQKSPAPAATGGEAQSQAKQRDYTPKGAPIDTLLGRLDGVRETGPGRYLARCPAHDDKSPSLSVRELPDGVILLHDFAGCGAADVLAAVGMTLADLFPDRLPERPPQRRGQRRIPAADALVALDREALTVAVIASDMRRHREIDAPTFERLTTAAARIGAARDLTVGVQR